MPGSIDLIVPTLTTPGPNYAQQINQDLGQVASHTHDGVDAGASIDIANQLCNEDLDLESHNLTNVRSVDLNDNPTVLTGTQDVNCLCVVNNVLGFNNSDGNFIPIVNSGGVVVPNLGFTNWTPRSAVITANFSVLYTDTYNLVNINSAGGAITGTLPIAAAIVSPGANPSPIGRLYLFKDVSGHAGANPITIQVAPASGNVFANIGFTTSIQINNNFGYVAIYTDGINTWFVWDADVLNNEVFALNESLLQLKSSSQIDVDSSSSVVVSGGVYSQSGGLYQQSSSTISVFGCAATCSGGTQAITGSCAWTFQSTSACTFASGSTLTMNGTLQGTTTGGSFTIASTINVSGTENVSGALNVSGIETVSGTLDLPGVTNLNGTSTMSGTGNQLTGTFEVPGGTINGTGATLSFDRASVITNIGTTNHYGDFNAGWVIVPAGSYTVDSGSTLDRVIAIPTSAANWTIIMPPGVRGRLITICDRNGVDPSTGGVTYTVTVDGAGNSFGNPGWFASNTGNGFTTASQATLQQDGRGNYVQGNYGAFWSVTLMFNGAGLWVPVDSVNFYIPANAAR